MTKTCSNMLVEKKVGKDYWHIGGVAYKGNAKGIDGLDLYVNIRQNNRATLLTSSSENIIQYSMSSLPQPFPRSHQHKQFFEQPFP